MEDGECVISTVEFAKIFVDVNRHRAAKGVPSNVESILLG